MDYRRERPGSGGSGGVSAPVTTGEAVEADDDEVERTFDRAGACRLPVGLGSSSRRWA